MSLLPLRALSILHELTVDAMALFDTVLPLENYLIKMASRLDARVILLMQAEPTSGLQLLGSAGLSRESRQLPLRLSLEELCLQAGETLPFPECRRAGLYFVNLQLGPEHSEYMMSLCFGTQPAPWLAGSLDQLGESLYRMLEHRTLQDRNLHVTSRLHTVLAASPDGILLLNRQGQVLQWNPAAERLLGRRDLHLQAAGELVDKSGAEQLEQMLNQPGHADLGVPREGKGRRGETWFEMVSTLSHVPMSQPALYALQMRDVTARRSVERGLRETKARLETLIEHLQAGVLMENAAREVLLTNQAFCRLFGLEQTPQQLLGIDCQAAAEQSSAYFQNPRTFLARVAEILRRGRPVTAEVLALVDGRYFERDYVPIRTEGERIGHLWVYRDVSEKMRDLAEHEMLSRFPDENPNPVLRLGLDGLIQYANLPAMYLLWYLNREVGQQIEGDLLKMLRDCQASQGPLVRELAFGRRYYQLVWVPIDGQDYLNVYAIDITARRQAEAAAMRARDEALDASAAKSEFLAMMSHEIRTPLNAVLGMLEVLDQTPLNAEQQQYLRSSREAGHSLMGLIEHLLDYSRLEAGQMQLESNAFSPTDLLDKVLAVFRPRAQRRGLKLHSRIESLPEWLCGDPLRLSQVLAILMDNAIKFTPAGEVRLEVEAEGGSEDGADSWELSFAVSDTGIGIAEDKQKLVFERFQQADSSNTRRYGGSGLGLSIARQLVELHDGELTLESRLGAGSTFRFRLRLPTAEAPAPSDQQLAFELSLKREFEAALPQATAPSAQLKLLIAEDYLENQMLIAAYLRDQPIQLIFAENGNEAVSRWREDAPQLVLMDVQMPELDGIDAVRTIRAAEKGNRTPIIALTADAQARTREICLQAGFDEVLNKPLSQRRLLETLRQYLSLSQAPIVAHSWRRIPEVTDLLELFFQQRDGEPAALEDLLAAGDFEGISRIGHGLKGSGSSFGFDPISALGEQFEAAAEGRQTMRISGLISAYRNYLAWAHGETGV